MLMELSSSLAVCLGRIRYVLVWWRCGTRFCRWLTIASIALCVTRAKSTNADVGYVGVNSCSASACHGSPIDVDGQPSWRDAYTIWFTRDPHSNSYHTLYSSASYNMVARLSEGLRDVDETAYGAFLKRRCTMCHATDSHQQTRMGVSCESCHGPAKGWLRRHTLRSWARETHAWRDTVHENSGGAAVFRWSEDNSPSRMIDTGDLLTRVRVCVGCHVGAPATAVLPARDANHDLIAAGHPRLNFDFASHFASLPRHWNEGADRRRVCEDNATEGNTTDDYEAVVWFAGQLVTADAALALLEARLDQRRSHTIWPELAEYSCFACHRNLSADIAEEKTLWLKTSFPTQKLGALQWGTWYSSLLDVLEKNAARPGAMTATINTLSESMRYPFTGESNERSQAACERARQAILERLHDARTNGWPRRAALLKSLSIKPSNPGDWDEVTRFFLAQIALREGLRDSLKQQLAGGGSAGGIDQVVYRLHSVLQFPQPKENTTSSAMHSPGSFRPADDSYQNALRMLREYVTD